MVDSTGLKIFGEGEWLHQKHNTKVKRKSWRKLHLGLDLTTGDIVCVDLTKDDVGDPTALPDLFDQIDTPVSRFLADGAYDGDPTSDLLMARFGEKIEIIIPPPSNAVLSLQAPDNPTPRDQRIAEIRDKGGMAWQVSSGYPDRVDPWTLSILERKPTRLATVAMANKTARIIWAVLTKNEPYAPRTAA